MPTSTLTLYVIRFAQLNSDESTMLLSYANAADRLELADKATPERLLQRGLRRYLIAHYLNVPAESLHFQRDANGKPSLKDQSIAFGISHTADAFTLAIGQQLGRVGVDIESIHRQMSRERLAKRYYSTQEQQTVANADNPNLLFLEIWTRKEAVVKAHGLGLRIKIASLDVSHAPLIQHDELGAWQLNTHTDGDHVISLAWEYTNRACNIQRICALPKLSNTHHH